jgi:hypothetical protein
MQFPFAYDKKKTIQALRFHFISRNEIRIMMILVNVFAIASAILFYTKKIRPEPFLLGSAIWIAMMVSIWYVLPYSIYKKSPTFKDQFIITVTDQLIQLQNEKGQVSWQWQQFMRFFESPHFFHLYFSPKSFFIIPKDNMTDEMRHDMRGMLNRNIGNKK